MTEGTQILVHDFRHQNFGIWTFLGWVLALFMNKTRYFAPLQSNLVISPIFFTKMAITQHKKVQIPKFWCLKSCTNIWLPFGNIHSIQKSIKLSYRERKVQNLQNRPIFYIAKKPHCSYLKKGPSYTLPEHTSEPPMVYLDAPHWHFSWALTFKNDGCEARGVN